MGLELEDYKENLIVLPDGSRTIGASYTLCSKIKQSIISRPDKLESLVR